MKKILIALPLVLVMLLSMIPVMAAEEVPVQIWAYYYEQPDSSGYNIKKTNTVDCPVETAKDPDKLKAWAQKEVESWEMPHDKTSWTVKVYEVTPYVEAKNATSEFFTLTLEQLTKLFPNADLKDKPEKAVGIVKAAESKFKGKSETDKIELIADDFAVPGADGKIPELARFERKLNDEIKGQSASASATVKPDCKTEKDKEPTCVVLCSEITVQLRDVHNGKFLDAHKKVISVNPDVAPNYQAVIELYMENFFPWNEYQPLKNYLNVYSILTPKNLEDCEIIIDVLPKYETIQIIHELYDCCITPDGKVKEDLYMSFIEDDEAFRKTGVPDGFLEMPFLEFHTGLMVNQDKAAEYAKTRLEKVNATDFVFQKATFFDGIKASAYVNGVVGLDGKVKVVKNDVPTIVIKYLRGECVKTDEKVDNAKVEAGVQTTTNAPAQQLPATGAKDITAFFMSAVALLGLGIFFAKKH